MKSRLLSILLPLAACAAPQDGAAPSNEQEPAASPTPDEAPAATDLSYRAVGQEPGWLATVEDGRMALLLDYGERRFTIDDVEHRTSFNGHRWTGSSEAGPVALDATHQLCKDGMSGMNYPDTVLLTVGDDAYRGCGGDPVELLRGEWRVTRIGDEPVAEGAATLRFDDKEVRGRAVCNSFEGSYSVGGEGMSVGQLTQTEMACAPPQMAQERAFLGTLADAIRFDIGADGMLTIETVDGRRLLAVREKG